MPRPRELPQFPRQLRLARVEAGHATAAAAAALVGMAAPSYWRLESSTTAPSWPTVRHLIVTLRLPLERFLPGDMILAAAERLRGERQHPMTA